MIERPGTAFAKTDLLPERLANWLRDEIVAGHLQPDERLVEQVLCKRAGVSRVPLREALRMLVADGLVTLSPHRGATVTPMSVTEMRELFGVRIALEAFAAEQAAHRRPAGLLDQLCHLAEQMRHAVALGELDAYHPLAARFHGTLVEAGGNGLLLESYDRLRVRLRRYQAAMAHIPELPERSTRDHDGILEAVRAGQAENARRMAQAHLEELAQRYSDRSSAWERPASECPS